MGRIRTIKPEFWKNEALSELPEFTHMLAAALLNYSDDEGYFNANHALIKAECFPLRESSVSIHGALTDLSRIGYLRLGTGSDGRIYGHIVCFLDHQKINRPTESKIKELVTFTEGSVRAHGGLSEGSLPEGKGKEGKGRERKADFSSNVNQENGFDEWWKSYPRKVGVGKAKKAYAAALKKTSEEILQAKVLEVAAKYANTEAQFIPHAATWLNGERWADEDESASDDYDWTKDPAYVGAI